MVRQHATVKLSSKRCIFNKGHMMEAQTMKTEEHKVWVTETGIKVRMQDREKEQIDNNTDK